MRRSKSAGGWLCVCVLMVVISAATASPARAQGSTDPNPGALTLTGGFDFANAYFFRGIFQDDTGVVMWPYGDLGFALHSGDSALKSVSVNIGTWNSLHTGDAGSNGPTGSCGTSRTFTRAQVSGSGRALRSA